MFASRWPSAKSAPVHQLAKQLYLRSWGHFKYIKPPPWASQNGEFQIKGPILGLVKRTKFPCWRLSEGLLQTHRQFGWDIDEEV